MLDLSFRSCLFQFDQLFEPVATTLDILETRLGSSFSALYRRI